MNQEVCDKNSTCEPCNQEGTCSQEEKDAHSEALLRKTIGNVALLDSRKAVTFSRMLKIPVVGIVENMSGFSCPHCGGSVDLFKIGGGERAASELRVPFLGRIVFDPDIVESADRGVPFVESLPESKAADAFREIGKKCEEFGNNSGAKSATIKGGTTGISKVKEMLKGKKR